MATEIWLVSSDNGETAVVRAVSGPKAMQMLGWESAVVSHVASLGDPEVILRTGTSAPDYDATETLEAVSYTHLTLPTIYSV